MYTYNIIEIIGIYPAAKLSAIIVLALFIFQNNSIFVVWLVIMVNGYIIILWYIKYHNKCLKILDCNEFKVFLIIFVHWYGQSSPIIIKKNWSANIFFRKISEKYVNVILY